MAFDPKRTRFIESLPDERNQRRVDSRRTTAEQSDHWQCTLLRARRERPRRRTAEQRNELAAFHHSITSSARAVGCTTGKSPGLAPLRILPA